jgi:hypothetical protein
MAILESALIDETEEGLYSLTMEIFDPSPLQAGAGGGEEGGGKTAVVIVNTVRRRYRRLFSTKRRIWIARYLLLTHTRGFFQKNSLPETFRR